MANPSAKAIARELIRDRGNLYSRAVGADLTKNTPSPLFRWCVASLLFSARISTDIAIDAANALSDKGWTTARKMADSTWRQRTDTLNRAGYARYDESTSRMLGDTCDLMLEKYGGDLRGLREAAGRDLARMRKLLKEFKGIGDTGVDIFFREAQAAWDELYPFADKKALEAAKKLGLGSSAGDLAKHVAKKDFPRLVAALVRTSFSKDFDDIKDAA